MYTHTHTHAIYYIKLKNCLSVHPNYIYSYISSLFCVSVEMTLDHQNDIQIKVGACTYLKAKILVCIIFWNNQNSVHVHG